MFRAELGPCSVAISRFFTQDYVNWTINILSDLHVFIQTHVTWQQKHLLSLTPHRMSTKQTRHVAWLLAQRRRRWANNETALDRYLVFAVHPRAFVVCPDGMAVCIPHQFEIGISNLKWRKIFPLHEKITYTQIIENMLFMIPRSI